MRLISTFVCLLIYFSASAQKTASIMVYDQLNLRFRLMIDDKPINRVFRDTVRISDLPRGRHLITLYFENSLKTSAVFHFQYPRLYVLKAFHNQNNITLQEISQSFNRADYSAIDTNQNAGKTVSRMPCETMLSPLQYAQELETLTRLNNESARFSAAEKDLGDYCFTTAQIKGIIKTFKNENYRFRILQLALPRIVDKNRLSEIASDFSKPQLKKKIKTLIHKQPSH